MKKQITKLEQCCNELADFVLMWYSRKAKEEWHMKEIFCQLARSATSIGANLAESKFAQSSADYVAKLSIARKEANETRFWIERMVFTQNLTYEDWEKLNDNVESIINMLTASIEKAKKSA